MIFQPGSGGSGGGLTAKTGVFADRPSTGTVSLGFEAKVCIVGYDKSADNVGFLVAGDDAYISADGGVTSAEVSLSSDGMTLSSSDQTSSNVIRYLALG